MINNLTTKISQYNLTGDIAAYQNWMFWTGIAMLVVFILAAVFLSISKSKFKKQQIKNSNILNQSNKTGAQVAIDILHKNGIHNVTVARGKEGQDHYNPKTNVIMLSPSVYDSRSIYAAAVAAHEVGHAIQWAKGYSMIKVRDTLAAPVGLVSKVGNIVMYVGIFGLIFGAATATYEWAMIALFAGALTYAATGIFQLVTLPVEFNASKRAKQQLKEMNITKNEQEEIAVNETLKAAAMTYVIAFAVTMMFLAVIILRIIARKQRPGR